MPTESAFRGSTGAAAPLKLVAVAPGFGTISSLPRSTERAAPIEALKNKDIPFCPWSLPRVLGLGAAAPLKPSVGIFRYLHFLDLPASLDWSRGPIEASASDWSQEPSSPPSALD